MMRGAELNGDAAAGREARHYRRFEQWCAASSDLTLTVTETDRAAMLADQADLRVELLPTIHRDAPEGPDWASRNGLMFIGGFWHRPNEDGICWFASEVLPLIERKLPGVELYIVGSNMTDRVRDLASSVVHPVGFVDDPDPYFNRCRVFVAPLRFGAGMKGKVGHSMSLGLPVVTTQVGAEGMHLVDGENALIADSAADFASAVIRLYSDPDLWHRISATGRRQVAERFSPAAAASVLERLYPIRAPLPLNDEGAP